MSSPSEELSKTNPGDQEAQQKVSEPALTDSTALVIVIEPFNAQGHVVFKTSYHYWDPEGEKKSEVTFNRGLFRAAEDLNTRLINAGTGNQALSASRVRAETLPEYLPPEEKPFTVRAAHPVNRQEEPVSQQNEPVTQEQS